MYNSIDNGAISTELSAVLAMLWVFGLMGAVTLTFVANRREETMRVRIGIEIETLRNDVAHNAPNESIAVWLEKMKAEHGEKYVRKYLKSDAKSRSEWRKTKKSRREAVMRMLPQSYKEANFTVFTEGWSQGRTSDRTKVITDGSLSEGGFEVVSHPLVDGSHHPWLAVIGRLLRPISRINSSCGLHIHVGLRDPHTRFGDSDESTGGRQMSRKSAMATAGKTVWAYSYFQSVFNSLVSPSRHHHQYCAPSSVCHEFASATTYKRVFNTEHIMVEDFDFDAVDDTKMSWKFIDEDHPEMGVYVENFRTVSGTDLHLRMYESVNQGRYYHVNTQSLLGRGPYGTIEFRQHQGTINPVKIGKWADLLHRFVTRCHDDVNFESIESYDQSLDGLWAFLDYPTDHHIADYYNKRAVILSGSSLIRACDDCGSKKCVHYECSVNDASVDASVSDYFGNREFHDMWTCDDCSETIDNHIDRDDNTAFCDYCECHTSVSMDYQMSAVGIGLLTFAVSAPIICAIALLVGCGIGAIHAGTHKFTGGVPFKGAVKRFQNMFGALVTRGGQASGFAWESNKSRVDKEGNFQSSVYYVKEAESSTLLKRRVPHHLTAKTAWAMGHTRFATHGKNSADNAHPHFSNNVTLVHNGVVHNHSDVYKALGIKPLGPVDSQAVVACLEAGGIEEVVKHCEGTMSLIWSDNRDPKGTLKFWTNGGNPLCFGRLDDSSTGMVVVCSTMDILEKSMGKRLASSQSCMIGREYTIDPQGKVTKRDIEGSEDTAFVQYDWRTYGAIMGKSKSSKSRKLSVKPTKASGTADNCAIEYDGAVRDIDIDVYEFDDPYLNVAINDAWAQSGIDGYPVVGKYHGYDATYHEGIRPTSTDARPDTYKLPNYIQGEVFDPMYNTDQMAAQMRGELDPHSVVRELNEYDFPLIDFYGEPTMELGDYTKDQSWDEQWSHD